MHIIVNLIAAARLKATMSHSPVTFQPTPCIRVSFAFVHLYIAVNSKRYARIYRGSLIAAIFQR